MLLTVFPEIEPPGLYCFNLFVEGGSIAGGLYYRGGGLYCFNLLSEGGSIAGSPFFEEKLIFTEEKCTIYAHGTRVK